jgi:hypothetical protein
MTLDPRHILTAIAIGLGATLVMDLWNLFLKRAFGIPSLSYCLLGRWIGHMPSGKVRHASIAAAPAVRFECTIGPIAHYAIGVMLAIGFILIASPAWLARPTFLPALLYGVVTVVFPFFLMQPSFGLGIASARTPHPARARLKSLMTHTVFGAGLYLGALGMRYLLGGQSRVTGRRRNPSTSRPLDLSTPRPLDPSTSRPLDYFLLMPASMACLTTRG